MACCQDADHCTEVCSARLAVACLAFDRCIVVCSVRLAVACLASGRCTEVYAGYHSVDAYADYLGDIRDC